MRTRGRKALAIPARVVSIFQPKNLPVKRSLQCYTCCIIIFFLICFCLSMVDKQLEQPEDYNELIRLVQVNKDAEDTWLPILKEGKIKTVNSFHKGLAQKFEIIFESGHICAGKPIMPEGYFGLAKFPRYDFQKLDSKQQRNLKRAEWEFQGWSEIVGYHVNTILDFNRKPPIVGRKIPSKVLYANDATWNGFWKRLLPSYDVPIALLPWVEGLQRAIPDLNTRDYLIGNYTGKTSLKMNTTAANASDKLVFDYLVDDHDTQGVQNWKGDITGRLLHWDTGLGWRDGPSPRTACYDVLCGTKQWKGIEHHDPNPEKCDRICRFRRTTVDKLLHLNNTLVESEKLSNSLRQSLKSDPLFPVFNYSLWKYYTYDKHGNREESVTIHTSIDEFFLGMDTRVSKILTHIQDCEEKFGADVIYLPD